MAETVTSVGIDIGTCTTKLVLSRLTVANTGGAALIPRLKIIAREVTYRSPLYPTPLEEEDGVDSAAVAGLVAAEYARAGVSPGEITTGAVIITGETAKKRNAAALTHSLAGAAGDFVVATAGPDLEAMIAAKGAGTPERSRLSGKLVANVDIGGGTSNVALFARGALAGTFTLEIGGRQTRYAPAAMASALASALCLEPDAVARDLLIGHPRWPERAPDEITFSGGVGELIYSPAETGDVGPALARAIIQNSWIAARIGERPDETLRATVIGAGARTCEISGSTLYLDETILPLRNLPVARPLEYPEAVNWYCPVATEPCLLAFSLGRIEAHDFDTLETLARRLLAAARPQDPLVVIVENDFAKALGQTLKRMEPGRKVLVIDQVPVEHGDYVDIGRPLSDGRVVPVVVKTLAFSGGTHR